MALRGFEKFTQPAWFRRLAVGPEGSDLAISPFHIKPTATPGAVSGNSLAEGDIYFDSTAHSPKWYNGSEYLTAASLTGTETFTNKTLTSPTITGATLTTPTIAVLDNAFTIGDNGDATKLFAVQCSGITTGTTRTMTVPDADFTAVGTATAQTLTNKVLSDSTTTIVDEGDPTKVFAVQCSGITAGQTRTWTVPDSSDTFVGKATTDVFTNKTLTSPIVNTPSIATAAFTGTAHTLATAGTFAAVDAGAFRANSLKLTPYITVSHTFQVVADQKDEYIWIAPFACTLAFIDCVFTGNEDAGTLNILPKRCQGTEAPSAGDPLISNNTNAGFTGTGVDATVENGVIITAGNVHQFAVGDRLGIDFTGDPAGELVGVCITATFYTT